MTPRDLAELFLEKARQDQAAMRALAANSDIADEVIGFHAQQALEKGLKAVLTSAGVRFGRTHSLIALLAFLGEAGIERPEWADQAAGLDPYAVVFRYAELHTDEKIDRAATAVLIDQALGWCAVLAGEERKGSS
jgi:HEPN domain-containing protein